MEIREGNDNNNKNNSDYNLSSKSNKEERKAIKRVISYYSKNYREILGIKENYNTLKEEKTEILEIYRNLRTLIHPDFSDNKNTKKAFRSK